ncbi:MAG: DNA polymerase III subunit epsilon [Gammaproteobacteria bacterium]|nr:DNA polymerase III subunit epsilon [Gammaproteobacteria bacterium]
MRQIILDTETTGLETSQDHRIIEIGCVELIDRRITDSHWHRYINPDREIDAGAFEVHGISDESIKDKPRFHEIAQEFIDYIDGAELIIHNAPFDVGFLDHEFAKLDGNRRSVGQYCTVLDTLLMARQKHPGQKNSLDALCKRYDIDNSQRSLHGALLDARILADVYLIMTGGQTALSLDEAGSESSLGGRSGQPGAIERKGPLPLWVASAASEKAHIEYLEFIRQQSSEAARE